MLHNEEYILKQIRKQGELVTWLLSVVGHLIVIVAQLQAAGGGSGASAQLYYGDVDPTVAPPATDKAALYYNTLTGVIFQWNVALQTWQ